MSERAPAAPLNGIDEGGEMLAMVADRNPAVALHPAGRRYNA
jgi:hypothetical protein